MERRDPLRYNHEYLKRKCFALTYTALIWVNFKFPFILFEPRTPALKPLFKEFIFKSNLSPYKYEKESWIEINGISMYHYQLFPKAIINFRTFFFAKLYQGQTTKTSRISTLRCLYISSVVEFYSKFDCLNKSKGLIQLQPSLYSGWGFLPSQWDRQLKFLAYASFLISWSLSKFELI